MFLLKFDFDLYFFDVYSFLMFLFTKLCFMNKHIKKDS